MAPLRGRREDPLPVLVIEDEAAIIELLGAILGDVPVEIAAARSCAEARRLLPPAGRRPVLITLDLVLPDGDGFAVLTEIRRRRELDDVPVLVISAQTDLASQKRAYDGGASDFVAKPFSIELLDAKLRAWLRLSRLTTAPHPLRDFVHEARNPLQAISAAAQVLARPDADAAMRRRLCGAIEKEADRLARLLLVLEAPAAAAAFTTPVEPATVLHEIAEFNVPDPGARARLHLPEGPLGLVRVDADRLHQMLLNIIDNALRMTAQGGAVYVEAARDADGLALSVRDTGPGIDPAILGHIFEDGFTTRAGPSRGLGLGITWRLCQAVGARLSVKSEPGAGATFTLILPWGP